MAIAVLTFAVFWLAYSNGANDNFKGVATLYGSRTVSYRTALVMTTAATLIGSVLSIVFARELAKSFSGKGLVPTEIIQSPAFLISVGAAGAITVLLATILGMPTSTTHALTGALAGVALVVGGGNAEFGRLWDSFMLPLLASPPLAVAVAWLMYLVFRRSRKRFGITRQTCICVGHEQTVPVTLSHHGREILATPVSGGATITIASHSECVERYAGALIGTSAQRVVDVVHSFSAVAVCLARGLQDTPKIAALLLTTGAVTATAAIPLWQFSLVAVAMMIGGLIQSRRVAETMALRITNLNPGQGLTANLTTALLVLGASRFGLPVSTTHVSCGAIFGIGMAAGKTRWKTVAQIAVTWITTLPLGALLGAALYAWLRGLSL